MSILHAALLGIIEGLTEFLPISSTFHLLFASRLLGIATTEFNKFFDVFIQAGAILAVLVVFGKEWLADRQLWIKLAASFLPTAVVGLVLHKVIKDVFFESPMLMIAVFIGVGVLFLALEWMIKAGKIKLEKSILDITLAQAVLIGLAQAAAVLPGVSRAGAVMVFMMLLGVKRDEAAKYSFSLAVPTILAAAALDAIKLKDTNVVLGSSEYMVLVVGTVTAFFSAFIVIKWFIQFLRGHSLSSFGWYRILAGALLLAVR